MWISFLSHPTPQLHHELHLASPTNFCNRAALALFQSLYVNVGKQSSASILTKFIQKHPSSSHPRITITTLSTVRGDECQYKHWVDYEQSQRQHCWNPLSTWRWVQKAALFALSKAVIARPRPQNPSSLISGRFSISRGHQHTSDIHRRLVMTVIGVLLRNMPRSSDQWITWAHIHRSWKRTWMIHGKLDTSVKTSFHLYPALLLQQLSCHLLFLKCFQPPCVDTFRPLTAKHGAREVQTRCHLSEHLNYHSG